MKIKIIIGATLLVAISLSYALTQKKRSNNNSSYKCNNSTIDNTTSTKRNCFSDSDQNGICNNYENKTCRKADFNEKNPIKKAERCDGSGYSAKEKEQLQKEKEYFNEKKN